jgi:hypothetical protein
VPAKSVLQFPAKQFTPEFVARELCGEAPTQADIMQDNFALTAIIFQLLNNGIHLLHASPNKKTSIRSKNHVIFI